MLPEALQTKILKHSICWYKGKSAKNLLEKLNYHSCTTINGKDYKSKCTQI